MKQRNQIIDLAKLIFCVCVLFNHTSSLGNGVGDGLPILMQYGFLSVEFFFIVSGFLMAKKAVNDGVVDLGKSTASFVVRKFSIIYPYFFVAWVIAFIADIFITSSSFSNIIIHLLKSIPFHLQLSMTGIPCYDVLSPTWYISAMLICMIFMYPLIKKFKNTYIYVIAPLFVVISYGYLGETIGKLATIEPLEGSFVHSGLFRGIAGMSLGCLSYGICERIKTIEWNKRGRTMFTVIEIVAYIAAILGMFSQSRFRPDFIVVFFFAIAVTVSFSGISFTSNIFKKEHPLIGKMSLTLYLADAPARAITRAIFADYNRMEQITPAFAITIILGIIILLIGNLMKKACCAIKEKGSKSMVENNI